MKKIAYLIVAALLFNACDLLDQEPTNSMSTDTAITSVEDLAGAVTGVYYVATYGDMLTVASEMAIYGDLIGPDSKVPTSSGQNASKLHAYSLSPADTYNAYYYLYAALANINKALEAAEALDEGKAPYVAELYALRGIFHFHLATYFAPIPTSGNNANKMGIVLSDRVFPVTYIGERASLDDTYKQIVGDLTTAIETSLNKEQNAGHANYWAALAMRARAYLYWGKYAEALADCREIIGQSPYTLYGLSDYESVWSAEGSSEMLMEYIQTDTYNAQRYGPGYYTSPNGYAEYGIADEFQQWLSQNPDDVRSKMVKKVSGTTVKDGAYFAQKYPGKSGANTPAYTNNIKVIRLSEVYLIAAEAELKKPGGSASTAAGYINDLRRNRIAGYTDVASVTEDDILNERRKELFAEGQIAFDYWRTGKTITQDNGTKIAPADYRTVLPLPKTEIDLSGGLLIQNPQYGN